MNLSSVIPASFWSSLHGIWSTAWPIIVAILLFGLVVFIHEFGHFFFAKLFKIKVNEFALGFGPTLLKFQKGETQYSWRLLPFGGFCAMEGEDDDSDDPRAFKSQKVWKRLVVVIAGALNNIILGLILVSVMLAIQGGFGTRTVDSFKINDAPSQASGLMTGDKILNADGRSVFCSSDLSYMLMTSEDDTVHMTVERDGTEKELDVKFDMTEDDKGNRFIALDFYVVGINTQINHPLNLIKCAGMETVSLARLVWMSLFDLVTGRYGLNEISGPVGVVGAVSETVSQVAAIGIDSVLYIMALITINLGIVNLMPLPALDGGRAVFLVIEGIRRKPVPSKYEGWIHGLGFALLMLLILIITGNDIWRLISGG